MTDPTAVQLTEAEREALSEHVYEAYRLGAYREQAYLSMWHELDEKPNLLEARRVIAAVESIVAARMSQARAEGDALRAAIWRESRMDLAAELRESGAWSEVRMAEWVEMRADRAALSAQPTPDVSANFREGECAPPPGCGCLCHQSGGMAVKHFAPCCALDVSAADGRVGR